MHIFALGVSFESRPPTPVGGQMYQNSLRSDPGPVPNYKRRLRHGPILRILAEHTPRKREVSTVGVDRTVRPGALQIIQVVDVLLWGADRRACSEGLHQRVQSGDR